MTRYFTQDHEWIDVSGTSGVVGITEYAQSQLGDITYVDLPSAGATVKKGDAPCVVDSVKAASDVYSPVSGTITAANDALGDAPELVNTDAEEGGWLFRIDLSDPAELDGLMDKAAYDAYVAGL
ncbi:glycine cleavage system protein GcvH [Novosphingobium sp.]|jgi:glycine cleavage system H protein|uniref:glycine cleavage system protein GcvH n=1 Tax=Novosphingobium sp. TaxID=1874826 RepID=UPI0022BD6E65|nr:glycine cleavage system protein GcvH [Novosphingobium sp.]MCZ8325130.1 glycine cleavage system protein GcvH [Sphingomonadaceae bacterium]MCZ8019645.1 glycine cleavage system protein GcvH [Novosphingobium sp.]MCZ8035460.1 glycine cleavage system protein GcvH [Novosphingobium sp.]MCZ8050774.1 glycine cleavage system protein GcvH [Novosphingobium sp.]MCZ8059120.1 glycine cleavage system protein GcvH [Novosphingobium sp.]